MAQGFTTRGQQLMSNSEPVAIASDQSELPVGFRDSGNLDGFFRLRTSSPETIFDSKQISDKQPLFWDDQLISGSGGASTYNANQASTTLSVANLTAAVRVRQTYRWFNYQPGKSSEIIMTGVWGAAGTGITKRIGQFETNNGLFFEQTSTGMGVVVRTKTSGAVVDTRVPQASWNLDTLDGNGPSGINLDYTKTQIMFIDYEWLGVGRVRFGWFVNGTPYYCHQVLNTNVLSLVYMSMPNLPLRYELRNDGTGAANSLTHICATVISEGGFAETGIVRGINRGVTALVTNNDTAIYPVIAIRLNSSYLHATIKISNLSVVCTSTSAYNWYLILNPTVVGTALSFSVVTNSAVDADVSRLNTTTLTGGTILSSGTSFQTNDGAAVTNIPTDFALGSTIAGVSDIIVLAVQRITGTSESFYASLNWREQV